jgi:Ni/Fe-hydrogenase subunit HybB-like protein
MLVEPLARRFLSPPGNGTRIDGHPFHPRPGCGELSLLFQGFYESMMFHLEYIVGVPVPFALLAISTVRESGCGLYVSSLIAVLGFITNRLNVSITALEGAQGGHYVPAWSEVVITLMLVAIGFGAFSLAVRYLNVYASEAEPIDDQEKVPASARVPVRETASSTTLS